MRYNNCRVILLCDGFNYVGMDNYPSLHGYRLIPDINPNRFLQRQKISIEMVILNEIVNHRYRADTLKGYYTIFLITFNDSVTISTIHQMMVAWCDDNFSGVIR